MQVDSYQSPSRLVWDLIVSVYDYSVGPVDNALSAHNAITNSSPQPPNRLTMTSFDLHGQRNTTF